MIIYNNNPRRISETEIKTASHTHTDSQKKKNTYLSSFIIQIFNTKKKKRNSLVCIIIIKYIR